jgi:hypothetical protein
MNLVYTLFAIALLALPIYSDAIIPPIYANCSTLPLYGPKGVPSIDDINTAITENGWFEALLGAFALANTSAIEQSLYDPQDGTVQVTLTSNIGEPAKMTFPKKPFPSDAPCGAISSSNMSSSAWVSAMYDGLQALFKNDNTSSDTAVGHRVSRGYNAIQGVPGSASRSSCLIPPVPGTQSLYALASSVPVVAAMYPNTTDPHYANRMVAVTAPDTLNSTDVSANSVSFASISVFGHTGVSDLQWSEWSANCELMFWS